MSIPVIDNGAAEPDSKPLGTPPTDVFPQTLHRVRPRVKKETVPGAKGQKRDNTFSKSRDTREDRGARQMKTMHNSQTFPHPH